MHKLRNYSLRIQLIFLAVLSIIPILGLIIYSNIEQRRAAQNNALQNVSHLTVLGANNIEQSVEGVRHLLITLAQLEEIRQPNSASCSSLLISLMQRDPEYQGITVANPEGRVICSARPITGNIANQALFQQAVRTHSFSVGAFQFTPDSHVPIIPFSYPFLGPDGQVQGVVTVSIDLDSFGQAESNLSLPKNSVFLVVDRNGTILTRIPDFNRWVGQNPSQVSLFQTILKKREGTLETSDLDHIQRIYAFTPVSGTESSIYVSIGIPSGTAYAIANRTLALNLIGIGIVAILALLIAWLVGTGLIIQPIQNLIQATRNLARGNLSARVKQAGDAGELDQLAQSFNDMAASLEVRTNELARAEENYRTLVEQIPAITYQIAIDGSGKTLYISPQIKTILGYDP